MKRAFLFLFALLALLSLKAQSGVKIETKIDSTEILIGQQAQLTVRVVHPVSSSVAFDNKGIQKMAEGLEVVREQIENVDGPGTKEQTTIRTLTLTSFDEALYSIPSMKVLVGGKPYATDPLALKVKTLDVDTARVDKFYGPKDVITPCYTWDDWKRPWLLSVVLAILFCILAYVYGHWRKVPRKEEKVQPAKHVEQPYNWAVRQIEGLKSKYTSGMYVSKDYYTSLTDVLRGYLQRRYHIDAMKMTSRELVEKLMVLNDEKERSDLKRMLDVSDLVKYAKFTPDAGEDQRNLLNLSSYVETTKLILSESELQAEQIDTESVKEVRKSRILNKFKLSCALIVLLCLTVVLLSVVVTEICSLLC